MRLLPFPSHAHVHRDVPRLVVGARHVPVVLVAVAAVALAALPSRAATVPGDEEPSGRPPPAASSPASGVAVEGAGLHEGIQEAAEPRPHTFATIDALELVTPSAQPLFVGFHEAAGHGTVTLTPTAGQVLDSRGRGTPPTSAADVALEPGDPVLAVVTGTVADVSVYTLYGRHQDVLVTIVPDARPDLRVRMLHIDDVRVQPGQHVTAGRDVVAGTARTLHVSSQVDRYTGRAVPHLHVEVTVG